MPSIQAKTYHAKAGEIERAWYVVDADGQTVGRMASRIAHVLRGKHKPQFSPSTDVGDFVIVINAEKAVFTGNKLEQKIYYRSSQQPGNLKRADAKTLMQKNPERVIEEAVTGMLPHNTLGRAQGLKLKIYRGDKHEHAAQSPQPPNLETLAVG